jgi:hypothetical protein
MNNVKIENFRLGMLLDILRESLIVDNHILLNFSKGNIKCISQTTAKTLTKYIEVDLDKFIALKEPLTGSGVIDLDSEPVKPVFDFEPFDVYFLNGQALRKFLGVFGNDLINLEFSIVDGKSKDGFQANSMKISGHSKAGSPLITSFTLAEDEMSTNVIDDYDELLAEMTPRDNMSKAIIEKGTMSEILNLVKDLHKSIANNSPLLSFEAKDQSIRAFDKVFDIDVKCVTDLKEEHMTKFNITKADLLVCGVHSFDFYWDNDNIGRFVTDAVNGRMYCLFSMSDSHNISINTMQDDGTLSTTLDNMDLAEYKL